MWIAANAAVASVYAWDKAAARRRARRVPERTLLLCAAPFCAPGAWLAVLGLRHKTRKPRFLAALVAVTVLQAVAAVALLR